MLQGPHLIVPDVLWGVCVCVSMCARVSMHVCVCACVLRICSLSSYVLTGAP